MKGTTHYLNTDLYLSSSDDLTELGAALNVQGIFALSISFNDTTGLWDGTFETDQPHDEPEPNIAYFISVVEKLEEPLCSQWRACVRREFDIGYECGSEPKCFNQVLSNELLRRIAESGAALSITVYPGDP